MEITMKRVLHKQFLQGAFYMGNAQIAIQINNIHDVTEALNLIQFDKYFMYNTKNKIWYCT